jgi:hypothetical protein
MRRRREEHDAAHRRRHERGKRAHERKVRDFTATRREPIDDGDDDALWFDLAGHPERAQRLEGPARWSVT